MSRRHKERDEVFAVLRWDGFHGSESEPDVLVTIKEVVRSRELAEAEVARLKIGSIVSIAKAPRDFG